MAEMNLFSPIHHFHGRFNSLDFIHCVFRVNVLPVLTVGDPVTPALPVWSDPGETEKRRHTRDMSPHRHAQQRVGRGGGFRSTSHQTSWGFMRKHFFSANLWIAFHNPASAHDPKPRQLCCVMATNGKNYSINCYYEDPQWEHHSRANETWNEMLFRIFS